MDSIEPIEPTLESGTSKESLTESERLFEEYLARNSYAEFCRIPEGATKQPDYRVRHEGIEVVFEVKEFAGDPPTLGFGTFDAYGPVRRKISRASKQFESYLNHPCCVVLHNSAYQIVMLDWQHIAGAMFGNVGFTVPIGGSVDQITPAFLDGGKMIRNEEPCNTRVSAILVMRKRGLAGRKMSVAVREAEARSGRQLSMEECAELYRRFESEACPSVLVVENPYAAHSLPRSWFCGLNDERFGLDERGFGCIFVGLGLTALEHQEQLWESGKHRNSV